MSDLDKGTVHMSSDGATLGVPVFDINEPKIRNTGILTVEQLRAVELRLNSRLELFAQAHIRHVQAVENALVNQIDTRFSGAEQRAERIAQEATAQGREMVMDLTTQFQHLTLDLQTAVHAVEVQIRMQAEGHRGVVRELLREIEVMHVQLEGRTFEGRVRRSWHWIRQSLRRLGLWPS